MKIRPVNGYVLIKVEEEEKIGTLFIPHQVIQKINFGTVIDKSEEITSIEINDTVYFKYYAGFELEKDFLLIPIADIQGKKTE